MMQSDRGITPRIRQSRLSPGEVLAGYDVVSGLYPHIPSLLLWRAWEYAAYRRFSLEEPVLDIGCGDGRYFRLVWPQIHDVVGVDIDPGVADAALHSGVYRDVYVAPAHALPTPVGHFRSAFSNCALEHMDHVDDVLSGVCRSLRPGASFVLSVVTEKFVEWATLPLIATYISEGSRAQEIQADYEAYHHLVNPFSVETWARYLNAAGFDIIEHIPILPEVTSRMFMFVDQLWHVKHLDGEVGHLIHSYVSKIPAFPNGFRQMVSGVLEMENDWTVGSGAVFFARKRAQVGDNTFLSQTPMADARTAGPIVTSPTLPEELFATKRRCWCGNTHLEPFSADYVRCPVCETLITAQMPVPEFTAIHDDEQDFYGREYWFSHQEQDLGQANILQRARADLPERCLYWLRTLLKYKLPPAKVLELGSAHGGFVALLRWAGFDAIGLELSPSIVDYAQRTFGIPMLQGPIEAQQLPAQSFDAIILNDVLEHLPDPLGTLQHCVRLLKPDGIMLIQTPCYPNPKTYQDLVRGENRFIEMLKPNEHLYLFSQRAVRQLFEQLDYATLQFKPALFEYDMYFSASKQPLVACDDDAIATALATSPSGRVVQALIDKAIEAEQLHGQLAHMAALKADVEYLKKKIERQESGFGRIAALEAQLIASEADRAARLKVIEHQGAQLGTIQYLLDRMAPTTHLGVALPGEIKRIRQMLGRARQQFAKTVDFGVDNPIVQANDSSAAPAAVPQPGIQPELGDEIALQQTETHAAHNSEDDALIVESNTAIAEPPDYVARIRDPKSTAELAYTPESIDQIIRGLRANGFLVEDLTVDPAEYQHYFEAAGYTTYYPNYYTFNLPEKSVEHFIAAKLLDLNRDDLFIDIASEHSPVPNIYTRQFGCVSYRQDLAYAPGMNVDRIGGDAANMPVPDGFASKLSLHCSFEHFEGDADIRFIREIGRVLRSGGKACFTPLYLFHEYAILTDPAVAVTEQVPFEDDAVIYCKPGWRNRHGRFYDPAHLASRIKSNLGELQMIIYRITNATEIDPSCYIQFAAVISKP